MKPPKCFLFDSNNNHMYQNSFVYYFHRPADYPVIVVIVIVIFTAITAITAALLLITPTTPPPTPTATATNNIIFKI